MTPFPSPNYGERRGGVLPSLIVLHYTAMQTAQAALERLCDPKTEVSAHYLIDEGGAVYALVPEEKRAWHAGAGRWGATEDVNSHSIGIELANLGAHPFPEPQMRSLEELLPAIMGRWQISPEGIIGHSDMAPDRKFDPGRRFDWRRLAVRGLSVWPEIGAEGEFYSDAKAFGYDVEGREEAVLTAFRQRFRPFAMGTMDAVDRAMMADLARRFPVDQGGFST